jgi:hypothetical protein
VNLYPSQYQLGALSAHVVSLLERRRAGFETWDDASEAALLDEARRALAEAGQQFRELADDGPYWQRVTDQVLTVALPRYLKLARAQHELEQRKYDLWRGGDLLSRALYALGGLAVGVIVLRTALPDWLEPLPLTFFIGGPLLPDLQVWLAKRRYAKHLAALVEDMQQEQVDQGAYQPLGLEAPASVDGQAQRLDPSEPLRPTPTREES